jgi:hypothetical protein
VWPVLQRISKIQKLYNNINDSETEIYYLFDIKKKVRKYSEGHVFQITEAWYYNHPPLYYAPLGKHLFKDVKEANRLKLVYTVDMPVHAHRAGSQHREGLLISVSNVKAHKTFLLPCIFFNPFYICGI